MLLCMFVCIDVCMYVCMCVCIQIVPQYMYIITERSIDYCNENIHIIMRYVNMNLSYEIWMFL